MRLMKASWDVLKRAGQGMSDDQSTMMGAAVAYYTIFSIGPLIVIAVGVAGVIFGETAGLRVFEAIRAVIGPQGAAGVEAMVRAAAKHPNAGWLATLVAIVVLVVGASGVFQQIQQSLNIIWKVAPHPKAGWWSFIRKRLLSFGMVAVIGFVLLVAMVVSAGLTAAGHWLSGSLPGGQALWRVVNGIVSLVVVAFLFAALFKLLPDVKLRWKDVAAGSLLSAVLFVLGKEAIGAYIGRTDVGSAYGAAGSLIIVLLWVYYSSQILFFGAEVTRAYATRGGRSVQPEPGAILTLTPFNTTSLAERAMTEGARAARRRALPWAGAGAAALAGFFLARGGRRLLRRRAEGRARSARSLGQGRHV